MKNKIKPTKPKGAKAAKAEGGSALSHVYVMLGSDLCKLLLLECILREHADILGKQSAQLHRVTDHISQVRENVMRKPLG